MKLRAVLLATLAGLSACASDVARRPAPPSRYAPYVGPVVDQFHYFRFDSWEVVSRTELVIWTGLQDAYLIKVWETCQDLEFVSRIGVQGSFNSVSHFDSIRVGRDRCPISEIRRIDVKQMKADEARARAQAKEKAAAQSL